MIQIKAIHVEEFRGIRLLDLRLDGQSFVVAGPNGSGKSGVVDAIDFALTGSVARLSGAGTGGVSLAKHGPHVHQRDNPAAASVALTIVDSASGQTGVLTRCVKTAATYKLEPDTPELHSAVDWAAQHPELILSRREVIKYVYTEPGKRAQEVQALLKLDRIDETRRLLRTAMTRSASDEKQATTEVGNAEDALRRHLDLTTLLESQVLGAVNQHRQVLGIAPLDSLQPDTDLIVGAQVAGEHSSFNKASALQDVNELSAFATDHPELDNAALDLAQALAELEDDPSILHALTHRELIEAGLPLVTEAACPLCDQPWEDAETLRLHLQGKLSRSEAAKTLERRILLAAARLKGQVQRAEALIRAAQPHALKVGRNDDQAVLVDWLADLAAFAAVLDHLTTIREQATRVGANPLALPPGLTALLSMAKLKYPLVAR